MTARILTALCFALAISRVLAQTEPSASEMPRDQQAYTEANKITDPEKKIAALEKFKTDFPGSTWTSIADFRILSTLIQKMPEQTDRIRKAAKATFAEAVALDKASSRENMFVSTTKRGSAATFIADQLATADLLLKDAERYARKGGKPSAKTRFGRAAEAYASEQKIPPPANSPRISLRFARPASVH
jgi:hypothetical protein